MNIFNAKVERCDANSYLSLKLHMSISNCHALAGLRMGGMQDLGEA